MNTRHKIGNTHLVYCFFMLRYITAFLSYTTSKSFLLKVPYKKSSTKTSYCCIRDYPLWSLSFFSRNDCCHGNSPSFCRPTASEVLSISWLSDLKSVSSKRAQAWSSSLYFSLAFFSKKPSVKCPIVARILSSGICFIAYSQHYVCFFCRRAVFCRLKIKFFVEIFYLPQNQNVKSRFSNTFHYLAPFCAAQTPLLIVISRLTFKTAANSFIYFILFLPIKFDFRSFDGRYELGWVCSLPDSEAYRGEYLIQSSLK